MDEVIPYSTLDPIAVKWGSTKRGDKVAEYKQ